MGCDKSRVKIISCTKSQKYLLKGCHVFLAQITKKKAEDKLVEKRLEDVPVVQNFPKMDPTKIKSIKDWVSLETPKEIRQLLGVKFEWGDKEEGVFQLLKQKLCSAPILVVSEAAKNFIVYCDASHKGLGDVLIQREKVIAYALCHLKIHEKNYTTHDLELGAKEMNMRQRRWLEFLSDYDCEIRYHPRKDNIKSRIQAARDRKKSYADVKCKPLEFQVGDKVMLKVSPWKGVIHFGKRGKLNPRLWFCLISFGYRVTLGFGSIVGGLDHVNLVIRLTIKHGISRDMGDDVDISALALEQYLALIQDNNRPGIVKPKIGDDVEFKINSNFIRELRRKLFAGTDDEDDHKHVQSAVEIVDLFHFPGVTRDAVMLRVFPITIKGRALRWKKGFQ
nr:hypothetical protein [Tanacetum cinerariifolium]